MAVLDALRGGDSPNRITIETNGTRPLSKGLDAYLAQMLTDLGKECFCSVSPKFHTSGEAWADTIKPEIVGAYANTSPHGQLKYVVDGDDRTWDDVGRATVLYRAAGGSRINSASPLKSPNKPSNAATI